MSGQHHVKVYKLISMTNFETTKRMNHLRTFTNCDKIDVKNGHIFLIVGIANVLFTTLCNYIYKE